MTVTPTVTDATAKIKVNGTAVASGVASGAISLVVGNNPITVLVTAQDGTTQSTYTVTVTRAPSAVSTLSGLVLSSGTLSPTFAAGTTSYTASVPNATTSITVTPTVTDATATIKVNGTAVASGTASGAISLVVGSNPLTVLVTAQDGTTQSTYTITVTRAPSAVATLSLLTLSSGTLSPSFASGIKVYTSSVANATTSMTVTPTVTDSTAMVTVNGESVASGTVSAVIPLVVGSNTISVLVTAQDGTTTSTYTVTVTRISTLSTLSGVALSAGTLSPGFSAETLAYTSSVANATSSITVTPTVTDATATVKVNGTAVTSGVASGAITLTVGNNPITVLVTAQDGTTTSTYTVTVNRISTVSTLSSLVLSSGALSPAFAATTKTYTASVPNATSSITVTSTVTNSFAAVTVNGTPVTTGTASAPIPLVVGTNQITVVGTAQDGTTISTYTITVTRISTLSTLSGLVLSTGTLSPVFATGTAAYTASVPNATSSITVTPTVTDATATIRVNGTTVVSGAASGAIPLVVGNNPITVLITAQDGITTSTYTVTVNRISTISTLSSLVLSSGTLSPTFVSATKVYTTSVANGTSSITVTPTVTDATATITVNGVGVTSGTASASISLVVGTNPITVVVTAQDGTTTSTYTITVTRISTVSTLSGLVLSTGTLSPVFATGTAAYTASVPNATSSITVTPTVTDATATVKVNGTAVASGSASGAITLTVGNNTITVLVTAQDGITTSTYTVTVNRISTVSSLSVLTLSSGTLSPAFAAATKTYTASVPNATASITVTPTLTNLFAAVTVNGTPVTSGTASASISLVVGTNPITVLVTAQDGTTTSTYTVTVTRFATDSSLSGLALSTGTLSPVFATGTMAYAANVPNATAGLTVTPAVTHPAATVRVNGVSVASGVASTSIPLAVGPNAITVLVTAQDPTFTTSYTVTVTRPALVAPSFTSATTVPCSLAHITTPANVVNLSLGYAPSAGNHLMVVRNTGLAFITGSFSNLVQGQVVTLPYNNDSYRFVVNYYGGTGNDLVLQWADNKAYTWGSNGLGQLGNTDSPSSSVPLAVTTSDMLANKTFVSIAVGSSHSVALCSDGTMAAWGNNTYGQLGDGSNNNSNVPVAVTRSSGTALYNKTVVAIAAGFNHSMALCSDGTVVAWGFNSSGQLGNSNNTSSNVPVAVTMTGALLNKTVVAIAAGYNHSLTRCADGSVFTWGNNAYGQLGNNTLNNSNVPVNITASGELNGRTVLFLVGGSDHSIGLCSDGSLVSWGRNNYGQLGNDSLINSNLPVVVDASDVLSGKVITAIATGGWHTLALCSDGTLAAFGRNNNGQLGNGNTTDSSVPVRVATATGVLFNKTITAIGGSNSHSLALCADGTLAAWGSNNNGQLGNDLTITSSNVPIAVTRSTLGSGEKFTDLATGSSANHVMALAAFHVSSNSTLSGLALSSGSISPMFAAGTTVYTASVSNATASVTVTPSVTEANAAVKVNGVTVASGTASASIPLVVGDNPISVVVTAQDGISLTTHTVTVTRVSTVSTLSGLALSAGALSPTFVTGITAYTASVTASVMSVTPTVTDSNAKVTVNGFSVATGTAGASIPLVLGSNPISVLVTAQDGTTQSTYTVTVTRLSTVSALAGLSINAGSLSPAFATGTTAYMAILPATATGVAVTPTASDLTSTIKVNGTRVASGATSAVIPITDTQAIATVVTAQDGSTTTYTFTVAVSGYTAWKARVFTDPADLADPAISGDLATPAHDGITNLMKYALALPPMTCGTSNLPTTSRQAGYLTLTYRKSKTASDVTYTVQAADSLDGNAWAPAATVVSQTDPTPGGGSYWLVTVRDSVPYAGQARRFMRLQVEK